MFCNGYWINFEFISNNQILTPTKNFLSYTIIKNLLNLTHIKFFEVNYKLQWKILILDKSIELLGS